MLVVSGVAHRKVANASITSGATTSHHVIIFSDFCSGCLIVLCVCVCGTAVVFVSSVEFCRFRRVFMASPSIVVITAWWVVCSVAQWCDLGSSVDVWCVIIFIFNHII